MHVIVESRLARIELAEIIEWYDLQSPGLGQEFLQQYDQDVRLIAESPERWPLFSKSVRRYVMRRFPHLIFYEIEADLVRVLGIIHGKRDSGMMDRRFKSQ